MPLSVALLGIHQIREILSSRATATAGAHGRIREGSGLPLPDIVNFEEDEGLPAMHSQGRDWDGEGGG